MESSPTSLRLRRVWAAVFRSALVWSTNAFQSSIKENDLGTTFGGGMIAMAAVLATLEAIENDDMIDNAKAVEQHLRERAFGGERSSRSSRKRVPARNRVRRVVLSGSLEVVGTQDHHRNIEQPESVETPSAALCFDHRDSTF